MTQRWTTDARKPIEAAEDLKTHFTLQQPPTRLMLCLFKLNQAPELFAR